MALRDRWVPIRFVRGADTEGDPKALEPGTPTEVLNGVLTHRITIEKRFGTERLSRKRMTDDGSYAGVSGALGLANRDDEHDLVMHATTDEVLSWDPESEAWVDRGDWSGASSEVVALQRQPNECWDPTVAQVGNVRAYAWQDARDGIYAQLYDLNDDSYSRAFRVSNSHVGRQPLLLATDGRIQLLYMSGTDLYVSGLNPARPSARATTYNNLLVSNVSSSLALEGGSRPFDACTHPSWTQAVVAVSVSGSTRVFRVTSDGIQVGNPPAVSLSRSDAGPTVAASPDGRMVAVGYKGTNDTTKAYFARVLRSADLTQVTNPSGLSDVLLDSDPSVTANGTTVRRHTIAFASGTVTSGSATDVYTLHAWLEMSSSVSTDRYVRKSSAYSVGANPQQFIASGTFRRHSQLASKAFNVGPHTYAWLHRPSTYQATDYLYREDGFCLGPSRPSLAVPDVSGCLQEVVLDGTNVAHRAVTQRDLLPVVEGSGSQFSSRHVRHQATAFQASSSFRPVDVGGLLVMPGMWLGAYDGSSVRELAWAEGVDFMSASVGSSSLGRDGIQTATYPLSSAGTSASYSYLVFPERLDALGNRHLGECLSTLTVYLSASSTQVQNTASISWPSMAHTLCDGTRNPYDRFAVYRTGPNLTTYQRVDDPAYPVLNTTSSDYVTFADTVAEGTRRFGELSYDEIEHMNVPPPGGRLLAQQGDRLYVAGLEAREDSCLVIPSKLILGGAPAFFDGAEVSADRDGGPITAIAGMDGTVWMFKRSRVLGAAADGPDNSVTSNGDWPVPVPVTSDVGAAEPAVVFPVAGRTEQGLAFESERGVRLLERGGAVKDIGSLASAYDNLTTVAGLAPRLSEEARLYTREGTTVVFNTRHDQWTTFGAQPAVAATLWEGRPVYAAADGFCYVEASGTYRDGDSAYPLSITLGWMAFAGLQGAQRVRMVRLLGNFRSDHTLRLEVAYDYRDAWQVLREIPTSTALRTLPYGGTATSSSMVVASSSFTVQAGTRFPTVYALESGSVGNGLRFTITTGSVPGYAESAVERTGTFYTFYEAGTTTLNELKTAVAVSSSLFRIDTTGVSLLSTIDDPQDSRSYVLAGGSGPDPGTYGSGSYGGADPVYQLEFPLPRQRCEAVRFRISDTAQSGSAASYTLTQMDLLVAFESGRTAPPRRKVS